MATGRNEPCPCGSGRKYKNCHGAAGATTSRTSMLTLVLVGVALVVGLLIAGRALLGPAAAGPDGEGPPGKVWSEEHGHWH